MGLFSTTYHKHTHTSTSVPYEKTVIEKRAPTDDSIKLWDEYLEKAKNRILSVFKLEDNTIGQGVNAIVVAFVDESFTTALAAPALKYFVRFLLNGEKFEFKFDLDPFEVQELRKDPYSADQKILAKVVEKMSQIISIKILEAVGTKKIGLKEDYTLK
tara:strand:- start:961 stop:1434 length:474 start_codon:yes stop_codon:yes gene_type:complete